jgi:hypothetical protein
MRIRTRYNPSIKEFELFPDFSGGLNTEDALDRLQDNELRIAKNVNLIPSGGADQRLGFTRKYATSLGIGKPQGYFYYRRMNGTTEDIVAFNGRLYRWDATLATPAWVEIVIKDTDGLTTVTFQTTKPTNATTYRDTLYIATGTKLVKYTTGNQADVVTPYVPDTVNGEAPNLLSTSTNSIHTCRYIITHFERIILSYDDVNGQRLYVSDLEKPDYFPDVNLQNYDNGRGEGISSVIRFDGKMVVFQPTAIHVLEGTAPTGSKAFQKTLILDGVGCIAEQSTAILGNDIVFLSYSGVQKLLRVPSVETQYITRPLDMKIKTDIRKMTDKLNAIGNVHNDEYRLCFPADNAIYRFDSRLGSWVNDTAPLVARYQVVNGDLYALKSSDGILYKLNDGHTDDGVAIVSEIETKDLDLSASVNFKKLKRLYATLRHFEGSGQIGWKVMVKCDYQIVLDPIEGSLYVDPVTNETSWVTTESENLKTTPNSTLGDMYLAEATLGRVDASVERVNIVGASKARRIRVNFKHDALGEPAGLLAIGLMFRMGKV